MINKLSKSLSTLAVVGLLHWVCSRTNRDVGRLAGVVDPDHPRVNQVNGREARQQKRIANGINHGSLNAKQAGNLEKREASVQKREQKTWQRTGHLTKAEQSGINRQQNRISKSIYRDKHK